MNTFSNFGGTWPKFFVLEAVDYFTVNTCSVPNELGEYLSCSLEAGKDWCKQVNGTCQLERDGYFIVGTICVVLGLFMLLAYIKPIVKRLEKYPKKMWKLNPEGKD